MKIRKAKKKDLKYIAKILMKESAKKPYDEKYNMKIAMKEVIGFLKGECYISIDNNEIVGFIAAVTSHDNKEKAYISELWIKSSYHKKGIGSSLIDTVENLYKKKKIKIIRLVAKKKTGAFKFYKKMKYIEYKEMVFMEKKLK